MKYMGSKARFAKYILPIILDGREESQWYIEPFAGGMNLVEHVDGKRIAADKHFYLIKMFTALVYNDWIPPLHVREELYKDIRNNKEGYPPELVGYVGFNSYGAKWFAGYRRCNTGRDYWREAYNNITRQVPKLKGIVFQCCDYTELMLPEKSIIYCDPPYAGTTKYKNQINYTIFWDWCRKISTSGYKLFVSEYAAPDDFKCVWSMITKSHVRGDPRQKNCKNSIEKLFTYNG